MYECSHLFGVSCPLIRGDPDRRRKRSASEQNGGRGWDGSLARGGNFRGIRWSREPFDGSLGLGCSRDVVKEHGHAGARAPVEAGRHSDGSFARWERKLGILEGSVYSIDMT